jgi:DNA-binding XRE family transcriptional regulator
MSAEIQVIKRDGKPEWAILPYETYIHLVEQVEMLHDIRDYDMVKAAVERGEEGLIPSEVVYAILDGGNPIKVWREHRGLTQRQLAESARISTPYLSQLESGKRTGTTEVLLAVAKALDVTLDDIVASSEELASE